MFPKQVDVWSMTAKDQLEDRSSAPYANADSAYSRQYATKKVPQKSSDSPVAAMGYMSICIGVVGLLVSFLIPPLRLLGVLQFPIFSVVVLIGMCLVFLGLNGQFRKSLLITFIPGLLALGGFVMTFTSASSPGRSAYFSPHKIRSGVPGSSSNSNSLFDRNSGLPSNSRFSDPTGNAFPGQRDEAFRQPTAPADGNSPLTGNLDDVDFGIGNSQPDPSNLPSSPPDDFTRAFDEANRKLLDEAKRNVLEMRRNSESRRNQTMPRADAQLLPPKQESDDEVNPFEQTVENTIRSPENRASVPGFPVGRAEDANSIRNKIQETAQHSLAANTLSMANRRMDFEFKTANRTPAAQKRSLRWMGKGVGDLGKLPVYAVRTPMSPVVGASILVDPSDGKISVVSPHYSDSENVEATFRAPEGFVVTGLNVTAGEFVTAIQFVCHRQTKTGIDSQDLVTSDWFGEQYGAPQSIGGDRPVVGFWLNDSIAGLKGIGLFRDPKPITQQ